MKKISILFALFLTTFTSTFATTIDIPLPTAEVRKPGITIENGVQYIKMETVTLAFEQNRKSSDETFLSYQKPNSRVWIPLGKICDNLKNVTYTFSESAWTITVVSGNCKHTFVRDSYGNYHEVK